MQSSWLYVALVLLLIGCTTGQSTQPAPTEIPSTEQISTPALVTSATANPATTAAVPAASPEAATPLARATTPVASAATPITSAATPVASAAAEVIILRLGRAASTLAPGNDLVLHTITFQPGSSLQSHAHPGETIFHLQSGALAFTLLEGEATIVRGKNAIPSPATPSAADAVPIGMEIDVNAGDTLYYNESAVQTERNIGAEDAIAIVINVRGAEEPRIVQIREEATPAMSGTPRP